MNLKHKNGLSLETGGSGGGALSLLTAPLCAATIYALSRLTGLENAWIPTIVGATVTLAAGFPKTKKWLPTAVLTALLLTLVIFRGSLSDGFCQWYKTMGRLRTAGTGLVLPALEASGNSTNLLFFAAWAGVLLALIPHPVIALLLGTGASVWMGRMIDPLPLLIAAIALCTGRNRKRPLVPGAVIACICLLALTPRVSNWATTQGEALRSQLHARQYETKYTTLPEGKLRPLIDSDATALVVTMEKPEALWLRGFIGGSLTEDGWEPLSNEILAENADLLYWLNTYEFDLRAQFEAAARELDTQTNTITVQNVSACSAYRYIPFTIRSDNGLTPENLADTVPGNRYDRFTTVYGGAVLLPELITTLSESDSRYRQAENAYREFVEAHYLTVPEEFAEQMAPWWDEAEADGQAAALSVLDRLYPDGPQRDPDYATAAVLTLRHFGIPARYAEGYILPLTTQTTAELTGRHAACWAEVYQDGIGWVPMSLTPGLDEELQEEQPDTPQETLPPETEPATEPESDGGTQVQLPQITWKGLILTILIPLLIIVLILLRRRHILKKRDAMLHQADSRQAVTYSFADAVTHLERMGIRRGNGSLDVLTAPIEAEFGPEVAEQFRIAADLNARALFSTKPMTEDQRIAVNDFRTTVVELLRRSAKPTKRIWMQYILCLF